MRHTELHDGIFYSWHVHRNGVIEWADAGTNYMHWLRQDEKRRKTLYPRFEHIIGDRLADVKAAFSAMGVTGPIIFCLSLTDTVGAVVSTQRRFMSSNLTCPVNQVHAHPLLLESFDEVLVVKLKPAFDHVMNAFGLPSSLAYGEKGEKLSLT